MRNRSMLLTGLLCLTASACSDSNDVETSVLSEAASTLEVEANPAHQGTTRTEVDAGPETLHAFDHFEVQEGVAKATLLSAALDVTVDRRGVVTLTSTPTWTPDGRRATDDIEVSFEHLRIGRGGDSRRLIEPKTSLKHEGARVSYARGVEGLYQRRQGTLKQTFYVAERISGDGPLELEFLFDKGVQAKVLGDRGRHVLLSQANETIFGWRGLKAWDANRRPLRARFAARTSGYAIEVDDASATYPITIDPLVFTPDTRVNSRDELGNIDNQADSRFGFQVEGVGDLDGDGFGDVVVSQPSFDRPGSADEGRIILFLGSPTGLDATSNAAISGGAAGALFGEAVTALGNIDPTNGTNDDFAVGAPNGAGFSGQTFIFTGQTPTAGDPKAATQLQVLTGTGFDGLGYALSGGDVDCDGDVEIIAGLIFANGLDGRVDVFDWNGANFAASAISFDGAAGTSETLGEDIAVGDINNDGCDDIIAGAPRRASATGNSSAGRVLVFEGNNDDAGALALTAAAWEFRAEQADSLHGVSVASADVNGDTFDDILVGANQYNSSVGADTGRILVFNGQSGALSTLGTTAASASEHIGTQSAEKMASSISNLGDTNGDGIEDVMTGAPRHDAGGGTDVGAVYVFLGTPSGLTTDAAWSRTGGDEGLNDDAFFGRDVGGMVDINNDGLSDMIVGAAGANALAGVNVTLNAGLAFSYFGVRTCEIAGVYYNAGDENPTNPCEVCDPATSATDWTAVDASAAKSCTDGDACTENDICVAGACQGSAVTCDDGNACTADSCDPATGCVATDEPSGTVCESAACADTTTLTNASTCDGAGTCVAQGTTDCAGAVGLCEVGSCSAGACQVANAADGLDCDTDSSVCTLEACQAGTCTATGTQDCDDNNECTAELCDAVNGCEYTDVAQGTTCGTAAACVDSTTLAPGSECDGSGTCSALPTVDCAPYRCDTGACTTACSVDADCADGAYCDTTNACSTENRAPTADAGMDQTVGAEASVTLDGSASSDPDNDQLTFAWSQVSGEAVALSDSAAATPSFVAPRTQDNVLVFELTVADEAGLTSTATTTVTVDPDSVNDKPVAVITGPDEAEQGAIVELSAADSTDPDGDALTSYSWSLDSGDADFVTLSGEDTDLLTVEVAPDAPASEEYIFQLVVADSFENSDPATQSVIIVESDPGDTGADAGGDAGADAGDDVGVDAGDDVGVDAGDDVGVDAGSDIGVDSGVEVRDGEIGGGGCGCNASGREQSPDWLAAVFALGGLALLRRRRK